MASSNSLNLHHGQQQGLDLDPPYLTPVDFETANGKILEDILFSHYDGRESDGIENLSDQSTVGSKDKGQDVSKNSSSSGSLTLTAHKTESSVSRSRKSTAYNLEEIDSKLKHYLTVDTIPYQETSDSSCHLNADSEHRLSAASLVYSELKFTSESRPTSKFLIDTNLKSDSEIRDQNSYIYKASIHSLSACKVQGEESPVQSFIKINENDPQYIDNAKFGEVQDLEEDSKNGQAEGSSGIRYLKCSTCTTVVKL